MVATGSSTSSDIDRIFSGSLERLAVDAVEILYTHAPDDHPDRPSGYEPVGIEATLEALETIRATGRVHRLGASNVDADQLRAAIDAAERLGVAGYEVIQNGYNLLDPDGDAEVRRVALEHGIAYTAYSALASGILTGKYRRDTPPPAGSLGELGVLGAMSDAVHDALDRLRTVAEDREHDDRRTRPGLAHEPFRRDGDHDRTLSNEPTSAPLGRSIEPAHRQRGGGHVGLMVPRCGRRERVINLRRKPSQGVGALSRLVRRISKPLCDAPMSVKWPVRVA